MIRLLIVEDEKTIRNGLVKHVNWTDLGIDSLNVAENGESALLLADSIRPDLIISDIRMPGMLGTEMARKIREKYPDIQIIFISGYSDKEYLYAAINLGVVGYVEKPIDIRILSETVKKAVGKINKLQSLQDQGQNTGQNRNQIEKSAAYAGLDSVGSLTNTVSDITSSRPDLASSSVSADNCPASASDSSNDQNSSDPGPENSQSRLPVQQVCEYIQNHLAEKDLSLSTLAEVAYLNPSYLSNVFSKTMGCTIGQYITNMRIERSKKLLKDPRYKLYQVADAVGYDDPKYFTRLFKKKMGITPTEYRDR